MPSSTGICIRCGANLPLIQSHIISEFMRNAFFGTAPKKGESIRMPHHRSWVEPGTRSVRVTRKAGAQSLPARPLMCETCDTGLGSSIEEPVAKRVSAAGLAEHPRRIYGLPGGPSPCTQIRSPFGESLAANGPHHVYGEYEDLPDEVALCARLCCWRAMHAMAQDGHPQVSAFLDSLAGQKTDADAKLVWNGQADIDNSYDDINVLIVPPALVADTVDAPAGLLPFGWYWVEDHQHPVLFGVLLWCAHWVALWRPAALTGIGPVTMIQFIQDALAASRAQLKSRVASIGPF